MARKCKLPVEVICLSDDEQDNVKTTKKIKIDAFTFVKRSESSIISNENTQTETNYPSNWTIETKDKVTVPDLPSKNSSLFKKQFEIRSSAIRFGIIEFNIDCDVILLKETDFEMRLRGGFQDIVNMKLAYTDVIVFHFSFQSETPVALIQIRREFSELFNRYIPTNDEHGRGFDVISKDIKRRHIVFCLKKLTPEMEKIHTMTIYHFLKMKCPKADVSCISASRAKEIYELVRYARIPVIVKPKTPLILTTNDLIPKTVGVNNNNIRFDLSRDDLYCLNDGQFLNDNIIDFYLQYIYYEKLSPSDRQRTYLFNSFFYTRLTKKGKNDDLSISAAERRYNRIKRWLRDVDIFSKDYLIVPINQTAHWYVIIIQYPSQVSSEQDLISDDDDDETLENRLKSKKNKLSERIIQPVSCSSETSESSSSFKSNNNLIEFVDDADEAPSDSEIDCELNIESFINRKQNSQYPAIIIFDSLHTNSKRRVAATLREFLQLEYDHKNSSTNGTLTRKLFNLDTIPTIEAAVPQQLNYFDCGLFVLEYIENFFTFRSSIVDFRLSSTFSSWCETSSMGSSKRRQILDVIHRHRVNKAQ